METVTRRQELGRDTNMQCKTAVKDRNFASAYSAPFEAMFIRQDWLPVPVQQRQPALFTSHRERCLTAFRSWGLTNIAALGSPSPLLERPLIIPGPRTDFMMFPAALDPLFINGAFPIPKRNQEQLYRSLTVFDFPAIYIVHEVPKDSWKGDVMPYITPPPPQATVRFSESLGRVASGLLEIPKAPLTLGRYAGPIAMGLAVLPLALITAPAGILLDPLVLGTVNVPQTDLWQYFILTGWKW